MQLLLSVRPPAKFKSCKIVCTLCRVPRSEEVTGFVVDTGRKSSKRSVSVLEGGQDAFSNGVASGENIQLVNRWQSIWYRFFAACPFVRFFFGVLLHNSESCNACTIRRSITLLCNAFINKPRDRMVLFLNCFLY